MMVLTVRQPWAGLIAAGVKDVENRSWQPHGRDLVIGQRFGIHAGRDDDLRRRLHIEDDHRLCHLHGRIIATVVLLDVVRDYESEWAVPGHWH